VSRSRAVWIYAGLLAVALAVGVAASQRAHPTSASDSVDNPGPAGIRALYLYLDETGFDVSRSSTFPRQIPERIKTLVISAPRLRRFVAEELAEVRLFLERGGIVVYLASKPLGVAQAELDRWLHLRQGEWLPREPSLVGGARTEKSEAAVDLWLSKSPGDPRRLGVPSARGVEIENADALPIAATQSTAYGWWQSARSGEIWIFAGADFSENNRIEEADNIAVWQAIAARGPMLFDESHHRLAPEAPDAARRALWIIAAQFVACACFFAYARGSRLGPPRPEIIERHRSSREYLQSIAWLTRRSRVEKELLREAMTRLRVAMQDRLGIAVSLPEDEAARALESASGIRAARMLEICQRVRRALESKALPSAQFAQFARELAQLERVIAGH
jgi:hypothetical protein